jgi:flagellar basal-body rod protein FlgG
MHSAPDLSQGPVQHTGSPLDVALDGPGFFKVQTRNGLRYTRDGALGLNGENLLVNRHGDPVLGDNGPIRVEGPEVAMGKDGQIQVDGVAVDRISVVDFKDPRLLLKEGGSYYANARNVEELPRPEKTALHQGYLEESNVDLTEEMIRMVEAFRAFESMQKGIQSIDEMTGKLINDPGLF